MRPEDKDGIKEDCCGTLSCRNISVQSNGSPDCYSREGRKRSIVAEEPGPELLSQVAGEEEIKV